MIKAISFDLWKTLIFSNPEFRNARCKAISENSNININQIDTIFKQIKIDIDESVEKYGLQYEII